MIKTLTFDQEYAINQHIEKWIDIGLNTDRLDYHETKKIINDFQREILKRKETDVIIVKNPVEAWHAVSASVWDSVWNSVEASGSASVWASVSASVRDSVRDSVSASVRASVSASVWDSVWDSVEASVRDSVSASVIWPYLRGSYDSALFCFYSIFRDILNVKSDLWEKWKIYENTSKLGIIYLLKDVCIVSEKPTQIHFKDKVLHKDGGPAIEYDGDFYVYALNGIRVPQWLAETTSENLSIEQFHEIKNADVKAEFIRKFGIDRMITLGEVVDTYKNYQDEWWTKSEYELIDMASIFESFEYAPFLKMKNQTTGIYHLEGVHPSCKSISDAIFFREGIHPSEYKTIDIK